MKKLIFFLLLVTCTSLAHAQDPVVSYRTEKGTDSTTIYVVHSSKRNFPGGLIVVEENWHPVVKDSLKSYVARLEKVEDSAITAAQQTKENRAAAREEIRRLKRELEGKDVQHRTVLQAPLVLESPGTAPPSLIPGVYIWDGSTWTPQAKVKKTTKKKR